MKIFTFSTMVMILILSTAHGALKTKKPSDKGAITVAQKSKGLSTDINFGDHAINGKYQYADEAIATVEDEKVLEDLLGMRTDFKDRLKKETKRR